jgi:hypothetical protein
MKQNGSLKILSGHFFRLIEKNRQKSARIVVVESCISWTHVWRFTFGSVLVITGLFNEWSDISRYSPSNFKDATIQNEWLPKLRREEEERETKT